MTEVPKQVWDRKDLSIMSQVALKCAVEALPEGSGSIQITSLADELLGWLKGVYGTIEVPEQAPSVPARPKSVDGMTCPTHGVPFKLIPAGVSKATGRPYSAFYACPERGCRQKPSQMAVAVQGQSSNEPPF